MDLFDQNRQRLDALRDAAVAAKAAGVASQADLTFARSLMQQAFGSRRGLSEKQWAWVDKLAARFTEAVTGPQAPAGEPPAPSTTFARLAETFLSAAEGLKWPKLRLRTADGQELVLSRCGERSRTPGWINVTDGGSYGANTFFGRISPDGAFDAYRATTDDVRATLAAYDADPAAEAKVQGARTGRCMCCGLELTDEVSIALGIGPVCGKRWGISRAGVKASLRSSTAADLFQAA